MVSTRLAAILRALSVLVLAVAALPGCKRERTRDIGRLPHVERARGKIQPEKVVWAYEYQLDKARVCYVEALAKDRNQRGTVTITAHRPSDFGDVDIVLEPEIRREPRSDRRRGFPVQPPPHGLYPPPQSVGASAPP
jgi:hypothetical protein